MCYRAENFIDADAAENLEELTALGHVPDTDSPHILAYIDPIEESGHRNKQEDPRGLEIRRHPSAMLRDDPDLWDIVDRFRSGVKKEMTHKEFEALSNFQIEAWLIMRSAHQRQEMRDIKERSGGANG